MDTVSGLRTLNGTDSTIRRKKGRVQVEVLPQREMLRPVAQGVDTFINTGKAPDVSSGMMELSDALRGFEPLIERYSANLKLEEENRLKNLEKEQTAKLAYYVETFRADESSGAVTQAQVGNVFPETVPAIRAQIAQALGKKDGKNYALSKIQSIQENASLRLNTRARENAISGILKEATQEAEGSEFYGAGFIGQVDKSLNEFRTNWMRETAAFHEDVQSEAYSDEILNIVQRGENIELSLLSANEIWSKSSSLDHRQRNSIAVDTIVNHALSTMDSTVLDNIPDRFLNAEHKARITRTRLDIDNTKYSVWTQNKNIEERQRKETYRKGQQEVLEILATGKPINPLDYKDNPELFAYANSMVQEVSVNPLESAGNVTQLRTALLTGATTGDFDKALSHLDLKVSAEDISESGLIDLVINTQGITPQDKKKLIEEIPDLLGGMNFLRNPEFEAYYNKNIGKGIDAFLASPDGQISKIDAMNVHGELYSVYLDSLTRLVTDYMAEHGKRPYKLMPFMKEAGEEVRKALDTMRTDNKIYKPEKKENTTSSNTITLSDGKVVSYRRIEDTENN